MEQKGALIKAYLGQSRDSLDAIGLEIDIKDSVSAFGPFIMFIIGDRSTTTTVPGPSVFEVLMSAQRITSLPRRIVNAKMSKKDNLYNAVLEFLAKEKVGWNQFDVEGALMAVWKSLMTIDSNCSEYSSLQKNTSS